MYHAAMSERKDRRELKCILGWRKVDSSLETADRIEGWSRRGALEGRLMTKRQLEEEAAADKAKWLAHKKKNPLPWDTDYEDEEEEEGDGGDNEEEEDEAGGQPFSTVVLGLGAGCEDVITEQADFWEEEEEDSGEESGEGDVALEKTL